MGPLPRLSDSGASRASGAAVRGRRRWPPTGSTADCAVSPTPPQGGSDDRALNAAPGPIPGRVVIHVSGLLWGGCPPGNAGVPPAPLSATASDISAPWFDRQWRRGSPRALPLRFTPTGPLTACNLTLTLRHLQPGIRLRAGRPRSRGASLPRRRVGPPPDRRQTAPSPTPPQGGSDDRALNAAPGPIPGRVVIHVSGLLWGGCPPGNAGVPPAPLSATASDISAPWFDRQRRRGSPRALPLRFTPTGPLTTCNLTLTLRHLQPGIRLRAGRPRSRGVSLPRRRVGPPPQKPSPFGLGFCDSPSRGE